MVRFGKVGHDFLKPSRSFTERDSRRQLLFSIFTSRHGMHGTWFRHHVGRKATTGIWAKPCPFSLLFRLHFNLSIWCGQQMMIPHGCRWGSQISMRALLYVCQGGPRKKKKGKRNKTRDYHILFSAGTGEGDWGAGESKMVLGSRRDWETSPRLASYPLSPFDSVSADRLQIYHWAGVRGCFVCID